MFCYNVRCFKRIISYRTKLKLKILNKKGFSLIDMLIYIAILSTVLLTITSLFTLAIQQREKADSISKVNSDLYRTALVISEEVKNADAILNPLVGTTAQEFTSIENTIESRFYVSNGNLYLDKSGQTHQISSNYIVVNSLEVHNLSSTEKDESIQINISYSLRNPNGRTENNYNDSYQFTISLNE